MSSSLDLQLSPRLTVWGVAWMAASWGGTAMKYIEQTTLNEKFNVFPNEDIDEDIKEPLGYFGLGRGSTYAFTESDATVTNRNYTHEPVSATPFHPLPLLLRKVGEDDLDATTRAKYAMRAIIDVNGVSYVAYYLKKLDKSTSNVEIEYVVPATSTAEETRNDIVGSVTYLNPVPTVPASGQGSTDGAYVDVSLILRSVLTAAEVAEVIAAKEILTGTSDVEITEIALFSGIPIAKSVTDGGEDINYVEVMKAQMHTISPVRVLLNPYLVSGFSANHNIGLGSPSNFEYDQ